MNTKKLIAGVVMFFIVYRMNGLPMISGIRLVLQVCSGVAVYGLTLLVLGDAWTKDMLVQTVTKVLRC